MSPENLKEIMKQNNLTVQKLADELEVSIDCVYKWLSGKRRITNLVARIIKQEYGGYLD